MKTALRLAPDRYRLQCDGRAPVRRLRRRRPRLRRPRRRRRARARQGDRLGRTRLHDHGRPRRAGRGPALGVRPPCARRSRSPATASTRADLPRARRRRHDLRVLRHGDPPTRAQAQGSGFVVSPTATILTNAHVVTTPARAAARPSAADRVYVEFADGDRVAGEGRRLGPLRRRRRAQGRPGAHALDAGPARRLGRGRRRRAGGGDRQPVRQRELAGGRRRLGDPSARSPR